MKTNEHLQVFSREYHNKYVRTARVLESGADYGSAVTRYDRRESRWLVWFCWVLALAVVVGAVEVML